MKNKIIRLTESDIERLVGKIIKEEGEEQDNLKDDPKDVENFLELADNYLFKKYGKYAEKINTPKEKATLIASLAKKWGIETSDLSKVKSILNTESRKNRKPLNEININDTVKKLKAKGKVDSHEEEKLLDYISRKIDGKIVGSSVVGSDYRMSITNTGFNVVKGDNKKRLFNFDQIGVMTKYINESKLNEAGGYDDSGVMAQHAGHSMDMLKRTLVGLQMIIPPVIKSIVSKDFDKNKTSEVVGSLASLVDESSRLMDVSMSDFTEDDLIISKNKLKVQLERLNRKLRIFQNTGDAFNEEEFSNSVYKTLLDIISPLNDFTQKVIDVDKRFVSRLSGKDRSVYNDPRMN